MKPLINFFNWFLRGILISRKGKLILLQCIFISMSISYHINVHAIYILCMKIYNRVTFTFLQHKSVAAMKILVA